jgi:predicted nucleic acid-binding protein
MRGVLSYRSETSETARALAYLRVPYSATPVLAAVAIANRLPLYTCNPADFDEIANLTRVPVPVPGR